MNKITCQYSLLEIPSFNKIEEGVIAQELYSQNDIGILHSIPNSPNFLQLGRSYELNNKNFTYNELSLKPFILALHIDYDLINNMRGEFIYMNSENKVYRYSSSRPLSGKLKEFVGNNIIKFNKILGVSIPSLLDYSYENVNSLKGKLVENIIDSWYANGEQLISNNWIDIEIDRKYLADYLI